MSARKKRRSGWWRAWILPALTVLAIVVVQLQRIIPPEQSTVHQDRTRGEEKTWTTLENCSLVPHGANDGDSFHIRHEGREYVMRLYFADCAEPRRYDYNEKRLLDQARDMGGLTLEQTLTAGKEATAFTLALLSHGPFRVVTRWEQVYDSERYYAFVFPFGEKSDLAAHLIRGGWARIHTKGELHPDGTTVRQTAMRLEAMESEARRTRRGVWAW